MLAPARCRQRRADRAVVRSCATCVATWCMSRALRRPKRWRPAVRRLGRVVLRSRPGSAAAAARRARRSTGDQGVGPGGRVGVCAGAGVEPVRVEQDVPAHQVQDGPAVGPEVEPWRRRDAGRARTPSAHAPPGPAGGAQGRAPPDRGLAARRQAPHQGRGPGAGVLGASLGLRVRTHLQNIYGKLQVSSRTAAVTRAFPDQAAGQHW